MKNVHERALEIFNRHVNPDIAQLPNPTAENEGKVAKIVNGQWDVGEGGGSGGENFILELTYSSPTPEEPEPVITCDTPFEEIREKIMDGSITFCKLNLSADEGEIQAMYLPLRSYMEEFEGPLTSFNMVFEIVDAGASGVNCSAIIGEAMILLGELPPEYEEYREEIEEMLGGEWGMDSAEYEGPDEKIKSYTLIKNSIQKWVFAGGLSTEVIYNDHMNEVEHYLYIKESELDPNLNTARQQIEGADSSRATVRFHEDTYSNKRNAYYHFIGTDTLNGVQYVFNVTIPGPDAATQDITITESKITLEEVT